MLQNSITAENYQLRPFEFKDLEAFARYRANPEVAKYQSWTDYTIDDAINLFNGMDYQQFGKSGLWFQLAITSVLNDQILGDVAIHFIDKEQAEIGFTVAPEHQGKAIATEAVSLLLTFLFETLNKHRVIATTDTNNTASCKLLEKLGFRQEAHFVQNIFFKGRWGDEFQYALLRSEMKKNRN